MSRPWILLFCLPFLVPALSARDVEIVACGGSQVVIFDADEPPGMNPKLKWRWDVKEARL